MAAVMNERADPRLVRRCAGVAPAASVDHDEIERRKIEEAQQLSSEQLDRPLNRIEESAEDAHLRRKVTFALAFAILLTGLLGFLSWRNAQQATETAGWV